MRRDPGPAHQRFNAISRCMCCGRFLPNSQIILCHRCGRPSCHTCLGDNNECSECNIIIPIDELVRKGKIRL